MKIKLYGTGSLTSPRLNACAMIDDTILFDCPNGLVKKLRTDKVDFAKIQTIIISHFHADHDFDMPFLLWEYNRQKRQEPLTIIAPKGFTERYKTLCDMCWTGMFFFDDVIKNVNLNIIETADGKTFDVGGYKMHAYKMEHANADAYGYRIEKDGKAVAFTGDAVMSENIDLLVKGADIAFIDVTGTTPAGMKQVHFDIPMYTELASKHKSVKVLAIHMNTEVYDELKAKGYNPPNDGDIIEI